MGREEIDIISPPSNNAALASPFPAPFRRTLFSRPEVVRPATPPSVCITTALIPVKSLDFDQGVNVTLVFRLFERRRITVPPSISRARASPIHQSDCRDSRARHMTHWRKAAGANT